MSNNLLLAVQQAWHKQDIGRTFRGWQIHGAFAFCLAANANVKLSGAAAQQHRVLNLPEALWFSDDCRPPRPRP
jgi:hypothetical protein